MNQFFPENINVESPKTWNFRLGEEMKTDEKKLQNTYDN